MPLPNYVFKGVKKMMPPELTERAKLEELQAYLAEDEWRFDLDEESQELVCHVDGKDLGWVVRIITSVEPENQLLRLIGTYSIKVPEARLKEMAELVTRLNAGIDQGYFYLLFDSGRIGFTASVHAGDSPITRTMLLDTLYRSVQCMNDFSSALLSVGFANVSACDAYERIQEEVAQAATQVDVATTLQ
jgi:hypothetical protein